MDISLFKRVLKKEALSCYNNVKNSLNNHPFVDDNSNIIDDVFEFELNQSLGKKAYSSVMSSSISKEQIKILQDLVDNYKTRIILSIKSDNL